MSLRDKDQQIKLLIKERDEQKFQAELMARKAEEWEEKFAQSELEKSHVTSEADDEVVELRRLAQELEDENRRLAEKVAQREQFVSDMQFKLDEIECEKGELKRELEDKMEQLKSMEEEQREMMGKPIVQVTTERSISKAKYEKEIEELKEKIISRDEQMIQLRTSLEMRKNEVNNLQSHAGDLERKLKIECERSERHLKRIDEINLELKASEAKLSTKMEENEMYEKQVKKLRQELRTAEEKLEQISLARKKDVDILHGKLAAARRGSTTPTSPQPYKTPTPQDEVVRLQMEIRDLKDQLIDREAELDCNRRDIEVMKRKMETRTLEVDCNNQELARRCQDLLEQNRQSEDTVKQLLKSTTQHSAQLVRATEDLKEANGKCVKLRDEINELETKLEEQLKKTTSLVKENSKLVNENEEYKEQVEVLQQQIDSLNNQISELCEQLDVQTNHLHKDREALADQLSQNEIDSAQLRHDLATAKQDLRTSRLQTQEVVSERDRLKSDLEIKENYIKSRNDIIETLRHELEDCKKTLGEYKQKLEKLRESSQLEAEQANREIKNQLESLKRECQLKDEECASLGVKCEQLQRELEQKKAIDEEDELKRFDDMRQKHSAELDALKTKLKELERQLEESASATLIRGDRNKNKDQPAPPDDGMVDICLRPQDEQQRQQEEGKLRREEYETQIEFLNSVVVDMQRKCDDYKNRLAQIETINIVNEFDNLITSKKPIIVNGSSSLRRNDTGASRGNFVASATLNRPMNQGNNFERPARISGRPYCDICSVYDLHHTIYCPKVTEKSAHRNSTIPIGGKTNGINPSNNNNNNTNNNNYDQGSNVDELFREYEQSIEDASAEKSASMRRVKIVEKPPRPYCDHCDLFGHTVKSCKALLA